MTSWKRRGTGRPPRNSPTPAVEATPAQEPTEEEMVKEKLKHLQIETEEYVKKLQAEGKIIKVKEQKVEKKQGGTAQTIRQVFGG